MELLSCKMIDVEYANVMTKHKYKWIVLKEIWLYDDDDDNDEDEGNEDDDDDDVDNDCDDVG